MSFQTKDSGQRQSFDSGMVRDVTTGKPQLHRITEGPMFVRWGELLARGAIKYPDVKPGVANWTLANGEAEYQRFRESAFRHFYQWWTGQNDEDHAAAVFFNINGAEYTKTKLENKQLDLRQG
jgi:hypothetical protein